MMKKFNHPNVLKMFGVSVYEEKPCILLPLMSNGDLKKFLTANKSVSTHIFLHAIFQGARALLTLHTDSDSTEFTNSTVECIFFGSSKGYGIFSRTKLCSL